MRLTLFNWLSGTDGVWAVQNDGGFYRLRPYHNGQLGDVAIEIQADGGADACVDSDGQPWFVWSQATPDGHQVYAVRCEAGAWGPRLQVSTHGDNHEPTIAADEYGNVWIVWFRVGGPGGRGELWMCRMGPRSGQQTFVANDSEGGPVDVLAREGRLSVVFFRSDNNQEGLWLAEGTEHQGFGEPVRVG